MNTTPKIVILMTEECIMGRDYYKSFIENNIPVMSVIQERSGAFSEDNKDYLANEYYEPPLLIDSINGQNTSMYFVKHQNSEQCKKLLESLKPDFIVLGGARILKQSILDTAKIGVLNAHPGIIPQYRGDDIIAWQIYNDDPVGVTCHLAVADVDAGPIFIQRELDYQGGPLIKVRVEAMKMCTELMLETIKNFDNITPRIQDESQAGLWHKMDDDKRAIVEEKLLNNV